MIDSGDVKFVWANFVLSQESQPAAEAAECAADQGSFWAYHDKLLENQVGKFPKDKLKRFATDLSLDTTAFGSCLDSGKYAQKVLKETEDAARIGIKGTPAFYLNGKPVQAQTFADIVTAVKKELNKQ